MSTNRPCVNIASKYDRVVVLVDMDCFYCQVEEKLDPSLKGKPIAVVQYNAWKGGGIIAVNYEARAKGVSRHMRGDEAKEQCPEIVLAKVPSVREKADLTKYREAGKEVASVLQTFTPLLERASVDEAYLDITEEVTKRLRLMDEGNFNLVPEKFVNTFAVGHSNIGEYITEISRRIDDDIDAGLSMEDDDLDTETIRKSDLKLLVGASLASEIRAKVKEETGYECSAGIAHNKILAKLACGINKPNKQTILPLKQIKCLFSTLPVGKIKGLGGKFGEELCQNMKIKFLGELLAFSEEELQGKFDEKTGSWLYLMARGIDLEAVVPRFYSKTIGCCKKFPGRNAIAGLNTLNHWFMELAKEISDRLEKDVIENNRKAKQMVVSYMQEINGEDVSSSRSTSLSSYEYEDMAQLALETLKRNTEQFLKPNHEGLLNNPIKYLGISVGKFENIEDQRNTLVKLFQNHKKKKETEDHSEMESSSNVKNGKNSSNSKSAPIKSFFAVHLQNKNKNETIEKKEENPSSHEENSSRKEVVNGSIETTCENTLKLNDSGESSRSFFSNALKRKNSIDNRYIESPTLQNTVNRVLLSDEEVSNCSEPYNTDHNHIEQTSPIEVEQIIRPEEKLPSSSNSDFMKNYAEYFVPEPKPEDYVNCEKCGKKVLSYSLPTHLDFHFAFELSQQQREEFRNEIKSKIIATSPPMQSAKRQKTKSNNNAPMKKSSESFKCISLDVFLLKENGKRTETLYQEKQKDSQENAESYEDALTISVDKEQCPDCSQLIPKSKMLEHTDYHTAKKLQKELNREEIQEQIKNKNLPKKTPQKKSNEGNRSIAAYFTSQS